jgi:plasmid maintenance system antidote protein VapI
LGVLTRRANIADCSGEERAPTSYKHWFAQHDIVLEKRGISADTAVRLARFFGTTEQFWLNLQSAYEISRVKAEHAGEIARIEPRLTVGSHRSAS